MNLETNNKIFDIVRKIHMSMSTNDAMRALREIYDAKRCPACLDIEPELHDSNTQSGRKVKFTKYKTITGQIWSYLDEQVSQALEQGWELYGEQHHHPFNGFSQVVVRKEEIPH